MISFNIRSIAIRIIAVMLAFSLHELAHGLASYFMGDPTAKRMGRLTLNPLAHVDPAGLLCLLVFGIGWGKPVPVDPSYYKDAKTGMIWTSFAGPVMNFVLCFVCVFLYYLMYKVAYTFTASNIVGVFISDTLAQTAYISASLGIFNCIPIPPLDGSKILFSFLPDEKYFKSIESSLIVSVIFIAVIASGVLTQPLSAMVNTLVLFFSNIVSTILF